MMRIRGLQVTSRRDTDTEIPLALLPWVLTTIQGKVSNQPVVSNPILSPLYISPQVV